MYGLYSRYTRHVIGTQQCHFIDAFAKLRKATVTFVMAVCLSVRMEQHGCKWTDFHEILYFVIFFSKKSMKKIQVPLKSNNNNGCLHENQNIFMFIFCSVLLRMMHVSDKSCRDNQKHTFYVQ